MTADTTTNIYKDMEGKNVRDINGEDGGVIFDFILDEDFKLKFFVARRQTTIWLISPEQINQIRNEVVLKVPLSYVKKFEREEEGWNSFTTLRTKQVYDGNGENIGQIQDVIFHKDNKVSFIIGGKGLRRYLERFGFYSEKMLVPYRLIKVINNYNIELHTDKDSLEKLFLNRPLDVKTYLSYEARQKSSEEIEIQLHRDSYIQVTQIR